MFGHNVSIKAPPISPAAILTFCPRADACLVRVASRTTTHNLDEIQFDARVETAKRLLASSVAGLDSTGSADLPDMTDPAAEYTLVNQVFTTSSERFDNDWQRLFDSPPHGVDGVTLAPPYWDRLHSQNNDNIIHGIRLLNVMSGTWEGRMEVLLPPLRCRSQTAMAFLPYLYNNLKSSPLLFFPHPFSSCLVPRLRTIHVTPRHPHSRHRLVQ